MVMEHLVTVVKSVAEEKMVMEEVTLEKEMVMVVWETDLAEMEKAVA